MLTTHYLEEADTEAERVVVIDHGEIIADDTAAHLKATLAGDRITVVVDAGRRGAGRGRCWASAAPSWSDDRRAARRSRSAPGSTRAATLLPRLLRELEADGVEVRAADVRVPTLDDVFLTLTGRSLREDSGGGGMSAAR